MLLYGVRAVGPVVVVVPPVLVLPYTAKRDWPAEQVSSEVVVVLMQVQLSYEPPLAHCVAKSVVEQAARLVKHCAV